MLFSFLCNINGHIHMGEFPLNQKCASDILTLQSAGCVTILSMQASALQIYYFASWFMVFSVIKTFGMFI